MEIKQWKNRTENGGVVFLKRKRGEEKEGEQEEQERRKNVVNTGK